MVMSKFISILIKGNANNSIRIFQHTGNFRVVEKFYFQVIPRSGITNRKFHASNVRHAIPPLLMLAIRPIVKVSAMIFGRTVRKWWQKLPMEERKKVITTLRTKQTKITAGFTIITGLGLFYYIEHIEEEPLTKRKRFIMYNQEQMNVIAQIEYENQLTQFRPEIVPPSHPIYRRITRVANRILQANKSISHVQDKEWAVTVIDRPDITNAFVLPHGKIVIFTGILNVASNDDQLAIVLSHEIAHALLQHMTENLSKAFLVEMILLIPLVLLWALLPDAAALFSQWLSSVLANIIIHLPFSRAIEKEADVVGIELAARACYDVREAPVFWGKMVQVNETEELEWLSTHPSNETRQVELAQLMPAALDIRSSCLCPRLPPMTTAQLYFTPKRS